VQYLVTALKNQTIRDALEAQGVTFTTAEEQENDPVHYDSIAIRRELGSLTALPFFQTFEPYKSGHENATTIAEACDTTWLDRTFSSAWPDLQSNAPRLVRFLSQMMVHNQQSIKTVTETTPDEDNNGTIYLISALLLRGYSRNKTSFLREALGLYLRANGTPRRVIDTLAHIGVISSYDTLNRTLSEMEKKATATIKRVAHDPTGVIVYDDFNYKDRGQDLAGEKQDQMVNLTVSMLDSCPELKGPMDQRSIDRTVKFTRKLILEQIIPRKPSLDVASRWLIDFAVASVMKVEN
jgi:hypothetical protein